MATSHYFNQKTIKLPGVYSSVKSLSGTPIVSTPYGKAIIVNVNPDNSYGGAINGELTKGADSLYKVRTLSEAQNLLRGGSLYHITRPLFKPSKTPGVNGISELYYINALTTTAPKFTFSFSTATFIIKVKDEGTTSNGVNVSAGTGLSTGYGVTIESGIRDAAKFIFKFWRGTFKGNYTDNISYNEITKEASKPELVCQSPEVANLSQLVAWMNSDEAFNYGFEIGTYTDTTPTSYAFVAGDKTDSGEFILAAGATSTYASTDLEDVLTSIKSLDFSVLILNEKVGDSGSNDTIATRLQYFIVNEVKGEKFLALAGKSTGAASDLAANIALAKTYNSDRVWLTHGTVRKNSMIAPNGYRKFDSIYLNALMVGRILGLPPQVPGTFKNLDIDGIVNPLNDLQKEDCLDSGVLTAYYDEELNDFVILRAINTLQNNTILQNPDGTSFSIQLTRISAQLNSDLIVNAKRTIFSRQDGTNRFTLSPEYLRDWTNTFLSSKVATETVDNLIIEYGEINVTREGDAYKVTYKFSPNNEIAFMFFTGYSII